MSKKIILGTLVLLLASLSSSVYAEGKFKEFFTKDTYVRGNLAFPIYNNVKGKRLYKNEHLKFLPFMMLGFGKKFHANYSLELEGLYREADFKASLSSTSHAGFDFKSYGLFFNAIFNPPKISTEYFKSFVGLGLGYIHNKTGHEKLYSNGLNASGNLAPHKTNNFAYQFILGTDYKLNKNWSFNTNIRWIYFSKISINYVNTSLLWQEKVGSLVLNIGAKYNF